MTFTLNTYTPTIQDLYHVFFFKDRLETDFAQNRFQTASAHFGRHANISL